METTQLDRGQALAILRGKLIQRIVAEQRDEIARQMLTRGHRPEELVELAVEAEALLRAQARLIYVLEEVAGWEDEEVAGEEDAA